MKKKGNLIKKGKIGVSFPQGEGYMELSSTYPPSLMGDTLT